jgi:hypothetical protein
MVLRIRFGARHKVGKKSRGNRRVALAAASLLTPAAAVMAGVLGLWRIAADHQLDRQVRHLHRPLLTLGSVVGRGGSAATVRATAQPVREKGRDGCILTAGLLF